MTVLFGKSSRPADVAKPPDVVARCKMESEPIAFGREPVGRSRKLVSRSSLRHEAYSLSIDAAIAESEIGEPLDRFGKIDRRVDDKLELIRRDSHERLDHVIATS